MNVRFACTILSVALLASTSAAERYHAADFAKAVSLSDPQISPDGKSIALVVSRNNLDTDEHDAEILLIDIASHASRVLTRKPHAGFPRWSPDGKSLAFLAADDKKHLQIFTLDLANGGDSLQLTHSPTSIEQLAWRPDGKAFAFVAEDEEPKREGRAKFEDAFEIGNNDFLAHSAQMPAHLWLVDLPTDPDALKMPEPKRLTHGSWSLPISLPPGPPASPVQWSPDGKQIFFVKVPTPLSGDAAQSTIQVLDVASDQFKPLTGATTLESIPVLSPNGSQIAYIQNHDSHSWEENDIFLTPSTGGAGKDITRALDRNIVREIWMPTGNALLLAGNDATTSGLWIQPTDGTPAQHLSLGDVTPSLAYWLNGSVGPHGELAFTGSLPNNPGELFFMDSASSKPVQLTNLNHELASLEVAQQKTITWRSMKNGPESDGVVTYPIGYQPGKRYPLVLYIHGGPTACSKQTWSSFAQLFAAQGWLVFEPNYRGSDNLGNLYQAAIYNDAGQGPGEDVMTGLSVLEKSGAVDTDHIAVSGWSYGGYMTSWLLGHYSIWKASVDGAAVNNMLDMYNFSDGNITTGDNFGGSPYTSPERMKAYVAQSPITYVANVHAPTLIMSDVGDYRVPITQSYAWYHALKDNNVVTQFIAYPIGGHSPGDALRRIDLQRRWILWLGQYLPTDPNAEASPNPPKK
jgi:dipeptidyl aminopeptidase/acylaminoacyl peptidase